MSSNKMFRKHTGTSFCPWLLNSYLVFLCTKPDRDKQRVAIYLPAWHSPNYREWSSLCAVRTRQPREGPRLYRPLQTRSIFRCRKHLSESPQHYEVHSRKQHRYVRSLQGRTRGFSARGARVHHSDEKKTRDHVPIPLLAMHLFLHLRALCSNQFPPPLVVTQIQGLGAGQSSSPS